MDKIKNAKRELALIVADIKRVTDNYDMNMSKFICEALVHYSQRQLVAELKAQGITLDQRQIAHYGATGTALKSAKNLNADSVLKALRAGEVKVSEVKAWGKNAPSDYAKPRAEVKATRKAQGITNQVSDLDKFKKSLVELVKSAKKLSKSDKAKVQDLAIELVSVLGIAPMSEFDLELEFDKVMN